MGSPPRMREKLSHNVFECFLQGITPAYAGKTGDCYTQSLIMRDHPRVCGKNTSNGGALCGVLGSPPRMREKLCFQPRYKQIYGITPAYAGKTAHSRLKSCEDWDHPRVCGKNIFAHATAHLLMGSPPRMREKLARKRHPFEYPGITPAYAGKT